MKTKILTAVFTIAFLSIFSLSAQEHDHSKMKKDTTKMEMDHSKMEMRTMYACPMHADVKSDKPGDCPKCGMELKEMKMKMDSTKMNMKHGSMKMDHSKMDASKMDMKKMYTCPMHADVKSDKAGDCPKCGMELKKMELKKETPKVHKH